MMQHIIKKQVIELSLDTKLDAFYIQQKVSNHYHAKILPLLLRAFDAAASDDEIITIERLEVNIGTIDLKELEKGDWEEKILKNISEQLIPVSLGITSPIKTESKSRQLSHAGQWMFYMRHGYLSWNVLEINDAWYKNVLEAFATDTSAINQLRELINKYPNTVTRIVAQHSEHFLKALVETLTAENQDSLVYSINGIVNNSVKDLSLKNKNQYRQELWEQVTKLASSGQKNLTTSKITKGISIRKIIDLPKENLEQVKKATDEDKSSTIDQEEIFVSNAGIVLLHPFFKQLFTNLHLINKDGFTNSLFHQKALYLLHYLAAGNAKPEEHELVMAKILCSFPLENPVDHFIELNAEELQEADSLLASAIGQWEILKSTSPDGLREGFLQRKGKLFTNNGSPVLQVEQGSIDMLLDQLPWNLSVIRLPWMHDILKVEWR